MPSARSASAAPPAAVVEVRDRLAEVIDRAAIDKERVVLTRDGKPLAALVPIEDMEALEALEDEIDSAEIRARVEEWKHEAATRHASGESGPTAIPLDEVARRHGIALRKPAGKE
jgi:prevent-host-death family protein